MTSAAVARPDAKEDVHDLPLASAQVAGLVAHVVLQGAGAGQVLGN